MSVIYSKVKAIKILETKNNIKMLEVDYINDGSIDMSDNEYKCSKSIFWITKKKPENYEELRKICVTMIKNVATNDLIKTCRIMEEKIRTRNYNVNE